MKARLEHTRHVDGRVTLIIATMIIYIYRYVYLSSIQMIDKQLCVSCEIFTYMYKIDRHKVTYSSIQN